MSFSTKSWQNSPSTATPIDAAALVDLEERVTGYQPESTIAASQFYVNIKTHGAVSGTDCTAAIKAAQKEAEELSGNYGLFFPAGTWIYSESLMPTVPWQGVPRKSILKNIAGFTYGGFQSQWCIINPHAGNTYNSGTADTIIIRGIDFESEGNSTGGGKALIGLANVAGGEIWDCRAKTLGTNYRDSLIDVYACVKRMKFDVKLEQLTQNEHGGCMWIRNLTGEPLGTENVTEKIYVSPTSSFAQTTKDEALAVYGVFGTTRDVLIDRPTLEGLASTQGHDHLASTFCLSNEGANKYASVINVEWRSPRIKDINETLNENGNLIVIGAGESGLNATNLLQNVKVVRPICLVKTKNKNAIVLRHIKAKFEGGYDDCTLTEPYINAVGSPEPVTGISGFNTVEGGTTVGNVAYSARSCTAVTGGSWEATSRIFYDCVSVGGDFQATIPNKTGVLFYREGAIPVTSYGQGQCSGGLALLQVHSTVGSTETITVANVSMETSAESGNVLEAGSAAKVYVRNNILTGPVELSRTGSAAEKVGNNWYGTPDVILAQGSGILPTECKIYKNNTETATETKAAKTQTAERDQQATEYVLASGTPAIGLEKIPPYMVVNFIAVYVYAVESIPADREHLFMALLEEGGKQLGITIDYTSATNTPMTAVSIRGFPLVTPWQNGPNWVNVRPLICETVSGGTCLTIAAREGKSVMQMTPTLGATGNTGQKAPGELPSTVVVSSSVKRPFFLLG